MENDEKKYEDVIKTLKSLQEVQAPANFEADLQRRINSEKFSKEEKKSFWENIFVPSRLIPSLGLVAVSVIIFFVVDTNSEEVDNPFLIEPRIREDVFAVADYRELEKKHEELSKEKSLKKEEPAVEQKRDDIQLKTSDEKIITDREKSGEVEGFADEKDAVRNESIVAGANKVVDSLATINTESPQPTVPTEVGTEAVIGQTISKEELNFRQIQLTEEEQKTVNELKSQVQSLEKSNKGQK
jgi:hypothetical protein